jgi:hypothetical protein
MQNYILPFQILGSVSSTLSGQLSVVVLYTLLIVSAGFLIGAWFHRKRQQKLAERIAFTKLEINKMFTLMMNDVEQLARSLHTRPIADDEYALEHLKYTIQKMESYLHKLVEKIKR